MSDADKGPAEPPELDPEAQAVLDEAGGLEAGLAPPPPKPPAGEAREEPDEERSNLDDVDMRDLLRIALEPPPGAVAPDLLGGVQRKLRRRSRGKFYNDGWSTARSPRSTYLFTSVLMLVLIGFVFLVLIPWGSGALP